MGFFRSLSAKHLNSCSGASLFYLFIFCTKKVDETSPIKTWFMFPVFRPANICRDTSDDEIVFAVTTLQGIPLLLLKSLNLIGYGLTCSRFRERSAKTIKPSAVNLTKSFRLCTHNKNIEAKHDRRKENKAFKVQRGERWVWRDGCSWWWGLSLSEQALLQRTTLLQSYYNLQ